MKKIIFGILLLISIGKAEAQGVFDHQYNHWQNVLDAYTHEGRVSYKSLKEHNSAFKASIQIIEGVSQDEFDTFNIKQKMAFWINAYNMGAIKLVLEHYPLKRSIGLQALRYPANSIQQIPGVWNQAALTILGKKVSLNYIENEMLRKEFKDPRVHFAIVCASLGCPALRDEPYVAGQLDSQLNDAVTKFVQDLKKFNYNARNNTFYLSPIFKWFKEDFAKAGGSITFIKQYIPQDESLPDDGKIQWLDYDWSLNEQ